MDAELTYHMLTYYALETADSSDPDVQYIRPISDEQCQREFIRKVSALQVDGLTSHLRPDIALECILSVLYKLYYESFPLKVRRPRPHDSKKQPWMTRELKQLINKKHRLLKLFHRGVISYHSFKMHRNMLKFVLKDTKRLYYWSKVNEARGNAKATWRTLNGILKRNTKTAIRLTNNNGVTMSNADMVNHFNEYFTSVAADLVRRLPPTNGLPRLTAASLPHYIFLAPTDHNEIKDIVSSFKSKRYHKGEIQPCVLYLVIDMISPILANLFNECMILGKYPSVLKSARVVPIFKSDDSASTLSVFNKLFEKII